MKIETLVRFSVKGIMELACTSNPPALLKNRNEEIVKSVNSFLKGIEGLKVASQ